MRSSFSALQHFWSVCVLFFFFLQNEICNFNVVKFGELLFTVHAFITFEWCQGFELQQANTEFQLHSIH